MLSPAQHCSEVPTHHGSWGTSSPQLQPLVPPGSRAGTGLGGGYADLQPGAGEPAEASSLCQAAAASTNIIRQPQKLQKASGFLRKREAQSVPPSSSAQRRVWRSQEPLLSGPGCATQPPPPPTAGNVGVTCHKPALRAARAGACRSIPALTRTRAMEDAGCRGGAPPPVRDGGQRYPLTGIPNGFITRCEAGGELGRGGGGLQSSEQC